MKDPVKSLLVTVLITLLGIIFSILVHTLFVEDKSSEGIVTSHIQTFNKSGSPEFYIYVFDKSSHHIYQKEVDHEIYYKIVDNTTVWYTVSGYDISDLTTHRESISKE